MTPDNQCNRAAFIGDVTIPDNTILHLSEPFVKTWRIKNVGTCTWNAGYSVVFAGGDKMGGPDSVALPLNVAPDQTVDISVNLSAPNAAGHYEGLWQLQSGDGKNFGVGPTAADNIWVRVRVITPTFSVATVTPVAPSATAAALLTATVSPGVESATAPSNPTATAESTGTLEERYDFAGNACAAQWQSNDGILACPGINGDAMGFVISLDQAHLEDGTTASLPTLLTFPQASAEGYILGVYPEYAVQAGDHFQTTVGCEQNATACSVLFRVSYLDAASAPHDLWTLGEFYDGKSFSLDLDLSQLAGQKIKLILNVGSLGSSTDDRALWVAPRIVHFPVPTPTTTSTPTATVPASTSTPSPTLVPSATPNPPATTVPTPGSQNQLPSISQIIESVISFFQQLLGGH